jgi:UDP-N-acetylmuramate dehydrogenase
MHALQALVLVNPDGGQLSDVLALAQAVQHDVQQRFDIVLEREPVCVGWSTVNHIGRVHDQT